MRRHLDFALLSVIALIAVTPLFLGGSRYAYDMAIVAMIYAMFAVSWDLACGTTGELSFGHSFFIGAAGFATAIAVTRLGLGAWSGLLFGTLTGGVAGLAIGLLTLKHTGPVFTLITMAAQLTLYRLVFVWGDLFGGEEGISISVSWLDDSRTRWLVIAALSLLTVIGARYLLHSSFGLRLRASGGDLRVGESAGVDVQRTRVEGFVVSGLVSGLAGSLLVLHNANANYELTGDRLAGSIFLLSMVGGMGTITGPWLAMLLYMTVLREALFSAGQWQSVTSVLIVFALLWLMPRGVWNTIAEWRRRKIGRLRRTPT